MKLNSICFFKHFLFSLFTFISFASFAQNDSLIFSNNAMSELNFNFAFGKQSHIKYQVENGQNPFLSSYNHAWEGSISYAYAIDLKWKFSAGILFGAGSFETPFEITNEKFPGSNQYLDKDYESGYFGVFDQIYSDTYLAIPLKLNYNIFQYNKHRIWLNAGIDIQYLFQNMESYYYFYKNDSANYIELLEMTVDKNPDNKFNIRFNIGFEYRYQLPKYNELSLGINYAFHTSDMYSGTYTLLKHDPNNKGNGSFSNRMDLLSLNVGYSINSKRKRFKKYQNHKNKMEEGLVLPPDTMSDITEFRFGTNPKLYVWVPYSTPNTAASMDSKATKFQMTSFTLHYLKYINDKWAWYTGLDVDFGAYNFNIDFAKTNYPFLLDNYHIQYQTLSSYFNIPIGIHRNIKVGKHSNIEISTALNLSINASGSGMTNYYGNTTDSMIVIFGARVGTINFITPGLQLNIGYAYETKRKNKWVVGLRGSANFIKSYTIDYFILNPDKSYYQGDIDMHPINLQLYWRYALTGKRKRYLKAVGY